MISAEAKKFAAQFAALGHANRVEILRHLLTAHPEGLVVGQIQQVLGIPNSTLSHHLEALRQEGLVVQAREGRFLRYRAGTDSLQALLGFLYAECCAGDTGVAMPGALPAPLITIGKQPAPPASLAPLAEPDRDQGPETGADDGSWKNW